MAATEPGQYRILIIDDEEMIASLMEKVLVRAGHEITTCSTAESGLNHCRESTFDMLITDLNLPAMDGISLQRTLAQEQNPISERVLFITGDITPVSLLVTDAGSTLECINKPFRLEALVEKVAGLLPAQPASLVPHSP